MSRSSYIVFLLTALVLLGCMLALMLDFQESSQALDLLKMQHSILLAPVQTDRYIFLIIFSLIYTVAVGLSLPVTAGFTLLAGGLFGFYEGVLISSFSSCLGALIAFSLARVLFKKYIQNKFSAQLKTINDGFAREGLFYLAALRLIPIFPFFLVNLLMGLSTLKPWPYYWVSQLSLLPITALYVYAGTVLAEITTLSEIISIPALLILTALGCVPLLLKRIYEILRKKQSLNTESEYSTDSDTQHYK